MPNPSLLGTSSAGRILAGQLISVQRLYKELSKSSTLDTSQARILWLLAEHGPLSLRQMSERLGLEQSTVNRQVNGVVSTGLASKERSEEHKVYFFELTDLGRTTITDTASAVIGPLEEVLSEMGERGPQFAELLTQFIAGLEQKIRAD